MGRLSQAAREMRKKRAIVNPQIVWNVFEGWAISPGIRARLRHGHNHFAEGYFYLDSTTGISIGLVAAPSASRADYESQGRIAIQAALDTDRARKAAEKARQDEEARVQRLEDQKQLLADIMAGRAALAAAGLDPLMYAKPALPVVVDPVEVVDPGDGNPPITTTTTTTQPDGNVGDTQEEK
jgi:hypothetical protein